jgi:outer membrane protein
MRSFLRATAIALIVSVASVSAQAQGVVKLGYVNTQALMDAAPGRAAADSALQKTGENFRAQLAKLQDSAQGILTKYQKEEAKLTQAAKDKYEKDLQALQTEIQAKQLQFQKQFTDRQNELYAPLTDLVKKVLDDIRTEEGYAMIFRNDADIGTIVSADKNLDLTEKVLSRLRATPAVKVKAEEPKKGAPTAPAGVTPPRRPPTQ